MAECQDIFRLYNSTFLCDQEIDHVAAHSEEGFSMSGQYYKVKWSKQPIQEVINVGT